MLREYDDIKRAIKNLKTSMVSIVYRSQMALDVSLCKTNKGQKGMSFLGPKFWNKVSLNIKTAAPTVSFTHRFKKEILSKLQESGIIDFCFLLLLLLLLNRRIKTQFLFNISN